MYRAIASEAYKAEPSENINNDGQASLKESLLVTATLSFYVQLRESTVLDVLNGTFLVPVG